MSYAEMVAAVSWLEINGQAPSQDAFDKLAESIAVGGDWNTNMPVYKVKKWQVI